MFRVLGIYNFGHDMDFGRFYYTVVIYTLDSLFNFFPSCTFKGKVLPETSLNIYRTCKRVSRLCYN